MNRIAQIGAVALTAGCFIAASSPAWSATGTSVEALIPVLSAPQTEADMAPASLDLEALGGIEPTSVRYLGADEVGQYWLGQTNDVDVCLITHVPGGYETSASNCMTLSNFNQYGLGIKAGEDLADPSRSVEAYYFPADVAGEFTESGPGTTARQSTDGTARAPGDLIAGPTGSLDVAAVDVPRPDGSSFRFRPLTPESQGWTP